MQREHVSLSRKIFQIQQRQTPKCQGSGLSYFECATFLLAKFQCLLVSFTSMNVAARGAQLTVISVSPGSALHEKLRERNGGVPGQAARAGRSGEATVVAPAPRCGLDARALAFRHGRHDGRSRTTRCASGGGWWRAHAANLYHCWYDFMATPPEKRNELLLADTGLHLELTSPWIPPAFVEVPLPEGGKKKIAVNWSWDQSVIS